MELMKKGNTREVSTTTAANAGARGIISCTTKFECGTLTIKA